MDKEKFVFLTGMKSVTVVSAKTLKDKKNSGSDCCKRYRKGKSKCKDCPEDKSSDVSLRLFM